ncbi:Alpha/Beta hydrolase protein [Mycena rebaudengoi]|nr:Alpha/Beta hydrolase protein [Mycena rebaudengoi]
MIPKLIIASLVLPWTLSIARAGTAPDFHSESMPYSNLQDNPRGFLSKLKDTVDQWYIDGSNFLRQRLIFHQEEPSLGLIIENDKARIVVPRLCDPAVKQYSGYFNIAKDKHLFFWFFESRSSPSTDPLVLWLNGGPGDSSNVGLLLELGPCSIASKGTTTKRNPHSWTNRANVIFLDQPVDVGFSYADSGTSVKNSASAAKDVYAFLQLFFEQFPEYSNLPFHIAGESYGGIYVPNVASAIWHGSHELAISPNNSLTTINLVSMIIANGITDPYIQIPSIVDYVCEGPYPLYDDPFGPECTKLRSSIPTCKRLIQLCNIYPSDLTCAPASRYCRSRLFEPNMKSDLNWYDLRKKCKAADRPEHCYEETQWIEMWLNNPTVKAALGVDLERSFRSFNMDMNRGFNLRGDGVRSAAKLLPELINGGVKLLVYAGKADMMANYMGNERWVDALETKFKAEFSEAKSLSWFASDSDQMAGVVRTAGGITFATVFEAGHMTAHDQPAAIHDLFTRWITNFPIISQPKASVEP